MAANPATRPSADTATAPSIAADCANANKEPLATVPPYTKDWIIAAREPVLTCSGSTTVQIWSEFSDVTCNWAGR